MTDEPKSSEPLQVGDAIDFLRLRANMTISFCDAPSSFAKILCLVLGHRLKLYPVTVITGINHETRTMTFTTGKGYFCYCRRCHLPLMDHDRVR